MRRDDQIAAAITGTFALFFAIPGGTLMFGIYFLRNTPDPSWMVLVLPLLAIVSAGGIGIWTVMKRPGMGALWYLSWSVVALVPLVLTRFWAPLLVLNGLPAVTLFIAALFAWKASRQPSGSPKPATNPLRDDF